MQYPYFIVQKRTGRLPCPPEYKHTPIERQFKSGRIGGTNVNETTYHTALEVQQAENRERTGGAEVLVYVVLRPNSPRLRVYNVHGRVWTIEGRRHISFEQIDEELRWPKSSESHRSSYPDGSPVLQ
jgi:hypothetical protein